MKRLSIHGVMLFSIVLLLFSTPGGAVKSAFPGQPASISPWASLGFGLNGTVNTIVVSGSDVYVGGAFTQACGNAACNTGNITLNHIARWNGSTWSALGYGVNDTVFAIVINSGAIDIGGLFTELCGNPACNTSNTQANYVAAWASGAWSSIGHGVNGPVISMVIFNSQLVIGGQFSRACLTFICGSGSALYNLAVWNSSAWIQNGLGVDLPVASLVTDGANLYAGGSFNQGCGNTDCSSGNIPLHLLGRWNGHAWSAIGYGLNGLSVSSLALSGINIYVGGYFNGLCENAACSSYSSMMDIAQWDGSAWASPFGGGLVPQVGPVVASGPTVYAGGAFTNLCEPTGCGDGYTPVNRLVQGRDGIGSSLAFGVNDTIHTLAIGGNKLYLGGDFTAACGEITCTNGNLPLAHIARYTLPVRVYMPTIYK